MEQALVDGRRGLALTDAYYVCLAVQNLPKERWLAALQATFDRWEHAAKAPLRLSLTRLRNVCRPSSDASDRDSATDGNALAGHVIREVGRQEFH